MRSLRAIIKFKFFFFSVIPPFQKFFLFYFVAICLGFKSSFQQKGFSSSFYVVTFLWLYKNLIDSDHSGIKDDLESSDVSEVKKEIKEEPSANIENISKEKEVILTDDVKGVKRSQSPVPDDRSKDRSKRVKTQESWLEDEPSLDNSVVTLDWCKFTVCSKEYCLEMIYNLLSDCYFSVLS